MRITAVAGFVLVAALAASASATPAFDQPLVGPWTATAHTAGGDFSRSLTVVKTVDLLTLPLEQRAAVTLCLVCGFSHSEAAEIIRAPLGTVKSHVLRGRERLREMMEKSV